MNRTHMLVSVLFLGLVGCGANVQDSCEDYNTAAIACIAEAYPDDQATIDLLTAAYDGTCDVYADVKGDAAKAAADLYDCYTEALDAGDCSTAEGYTAIGEANLACVSGGA